ncbi:MAG: hypothetical protein KBC48_01345 [Candidatus Pacebacteria bacterium]|nr:hypothetical protein [Candidatus Paceibacterota bacterium]
MSIVYSVYQRVVMRIVPDCTPAEYLEFKDKKYRHSGGCPPTDVYGEGAPLHRSDTYRHSYED